MFHHEVLQPIREARGLKMDAVASETGVSKGFLSMLESGKRNPSADVLTRLARALRVPSEVFRNQDHPITVQVQRIQNEQEALRNLL